MLVTPAGRLLGPLTTVHMAPLHTKHSLSPLPSASPELSVTLVLGCPKESEPGRGRGRGRAPALGTCIEIHSFGNSDTSESLQTTFSQCPGAAALTCAASLTAVTAVCVDTVNLISYRAAGQQGRDS